MKTLFRFACVVSLFCLLGPISAFAQDSFHINSRLENVTTANGMLSGDLLIDVLNVSGAVASNVTVWIDGPNDVTFDSRRISLGNLSAGEVLGVMDVFSLPATVRSAGTGPAVWNVEFTDAAGQQQAVQVVGVKVPGSEGGK